MATTKSALQINPDPMIKLIMQLPGRVLYVQKEQCWTLIITGSALESVWQTTVYKDELEYDAEAAEEG